MNQRLKSSVVIATYYRYEVLEILLSLLKDQTLPADEIVIVDQTPLADRPDQFYEKKSDLPLVLLNLKQPSLTRSRNIGAKKATGDLLIFIDDDMVFSKNHIAMHVNTIVEENVDVVYGAYSEEEVLPDIFERNLKRLDPLSFFLKSPRKKWNGMVLVTSGANTSIYKSLFFEVGGFDENMPRMEDIEFGYRLFLHGAKMYYSDKPFAQHKRWHTGGTRKSQDHLPYVRLVSKLYLHKKHFPGWTTKQFILRELCSALLFREYSSAKFRPKLLLQPYMPFVRIYRVLQANLEAGRLLSS